MMEIRLDADEVYRLQDGLTEAVRATEEAVQRFVEPASGTLRVALTRRPHLIFGRRGSGKTSLLRKAIAEHNLDRRPSAFVDLEPFKGHTYPDVLISVLIEFFRSLKRWLDEAAVAPKNRSTVWKRWFSTPRRGPLARGPAREISTEIDLVLTELEVLLHAQDDAEIERRSALSTKQAAGLQAAASFPSAGSLSGGGSVEEGQTDEVLERLRRSKTHYLHRQILKYQQLLKRVADLAGHDGLLVLDDLYYIRRADQPLVVDYFHRLTKNQGLWLKVGTIRHRSTWYLPGDPPRGAKLGDDADSIDLDIALEKYRTAKMFLTQILRQIADDVFKDPATSKSFMDLLTEGAVDRLVLASGGVA